MPRPTTKHELLWLANERFNKLWAMIDALTPAQQQATFDFDSLPPQKEAHWQRDRNLRDVLMHLHEWHQLLLTWVEANQRGQAQPFLPAPYNWKTYGEMNVGFFEKHQATPYAESSRLVKDSHQAVMALIDQFSTQELFTPKHFAWTGTTTLGSYCVSATSSHYDWAIKKVKAHGKTCQA